MNDDSRFVVWIAAKWYHIHRVCQGHGAILLIDPRSGASEEFRVDELANALHTGLARLECVTTSNRR